VAKNPCHFLAPFITQFKNKNKTASWLRLGSGFFMGV
jgi:hypothetical protein